MTAGPPARWIAPSTPPPPASRSLAAFTITSAAIRVMSPTVSAMTRPGATTSPASVPATRRAYVRYLQPGGSRARDPYDDRMDLETGRTTDRRPPFRYSALARVWFSDTDAQGVVYYGRYLPYFDHARTEYHRHLGLTQSAREGEFAMRASAVEYVAPARFDDL